MPRYSTWLDTLPQYPFARVGRLSREVEQRDGIKVINARIGIPDREAPSAVKRLMSQFVSQEGSTYGYPVDVYPERGIPELVDAIIRHYRERHGTEVKPENIAVTSWTKEVLHNLARLFDSGSVVIPEPVYPAYEGATLLSGHRAKRVKTSEESGWIPEFEFDDNDVLFYFCDPNNPTGNMFDEAAIVILIDFSYR